MNKPLLNAFVVEDVRAVAFKLNQLVLIIVFYIANRAFGLERAIEKRLCFVVFILILLLLYLFVHLLFVGIELLNLCQIVPPIRSLFVINVF